MVSKVEPLKALSRSKGSVSSVAKIERLGSSGFISVDQLLEKHVGFSPELGLAKPAKVTKDIFRLPSLPSRPSRDTISVVRAPCPLWQTKPGD